MANYMVDMAELKKRGYVVKLQGNKDYVTVSGTLFLGHDSGMLVGIDVDIVNADDEWIDAKATATVYNEAIVKRIIDLNLDPEAKLILIDKVAVGEFSGNSRSRAKGGKQAEGTNPYEVAATSAIGRALRAAGFGEMESLATADEVAVAISRQAAAPVAEDGPRDYSKMVGKAATEKQIALLKRMAKQKLGVGSAMEMDKAANERFGKLFDDLDMADVSKFIDDLKAPKQEADEPPF